VSGEKKKGKKGDRNMSNAQRSSGGARSGSGDSDVAGSHIDRHTDREICTRNRVAHLGGTCEDVIQYSSSSASG
jgi:hypothetical protein